MLDVVYCNIIQCQTTSAVDLLVTIETKPVPSTLSELEQSEARPKPTTELISIPPAPPAPSTANLMVVTGPDSSTLIGDDYRFRFSYSHLCGTPLLMVTSFDSLVVASNTPLMSIMSMPQKTSPSVIVSSMLKAGSKRSSFQSWWAASIKA